MSNEKEGMRRKCTICKNLLLDLQQTNTVHNLEESKVLEQIRELGLVDIDEAKISSFVLCNMCRNKADIAHQFVKTCRALLTGQSSKESKRLKDSDMEVQSPQQTIVIVNGVGRWIGAKKLEKIFSKYGRIVDLYMRPQCRCDWMTRSEGFAWIRFSMEDGARKVMDAAQNGELYHKDDPLLVTLVSEDCALIDTLPNTCLAGIFLHLDDVDDKVNIGKVCKRWKEVLAASWSNVTQLSDNCRLEDMKSVGELRSIFKGCGHFLKSLSLSIANCPTSRIKMITEYCKSIQNLQLSLECKRRTVESQHEILSVFQQCSMLRRLYIENLDELFNCNHLESLPREMLEIHLFSEDVNIRPSIELSKFQNLEALALWNFKICENSLQGIGNLVNLKHLSFEGSIVHPSNVRHIQNFKKLEHLAIAGCNIDDEILAQILRNNRRLQYLDISDIRSITDRSFQYISRLSKLKTLWMKNLSKVTGLDLTKITTLEELDVDGCSSMADWILMMVIDKCTKLSDVYANGVATWRLMINADEVMKLDTTDRTLDLFINESLAKRWNESDRTEDRISVWTTSRSLKADGEWDGWHGNVEALE